MLPILVSIGPVKIYSMGVFLFLGLFAGLYWWWKIGRDEHWEENRLFDSYFLALLFFFVGGRVGHVVMNPAMFEGWRSLALLAYPGINYGVGILCSYLFIIFYARKEEWEAWKTVDGWSAVVTTVMLIAAVGMILNGSNPGKAVSWGLMYPGMEQRYIPVDIWFFFWALLAFAIVSRVRKYFRFYSWYKGDASVAKDGLAGIVLLLLTGIYYLGAGLMDSSIFYYGASLIPIAGCMIYLRSGKNRGGELLNKILRRN